MRSTAPVSPAPARSSSSVADASSSAIEPSCPPRLAHATYFTLNNLTVASPLPGRKPPGYAIVGAVAVAVPFSNFPEFGVMVTLHEDGDVLHVVALNPPEPSMIVVNLPVTFCVWCNPTATVTRPSFEHVIVPVSV